MNTHASETFPALSPREFVDAMDHRGALLSERRTHNSTPSQDARPDDGLDDLTRAITSSLEAHPGDLRRLDVDNDYDLIARLVLSEPVHPLRNPEDPAEITSRVAGDRRCYVLESDLAPNRPLNAVFVALCPDLPEGMDEILDQDRRKISLTDARVAVFYSIWNVEPGLVGIPGGSKLLSEVLASMRAEFPQIETYTTLSPIPGFRRWLIANDPDQAVELDRVSDIVRASATAAQEAQHRSDGSQLLLEDSAASTPLIRSCLRYLLATDNKGLPLDPVTRFHMRNGARLWRIAPNADLSISGVERSWGLMVNYRYYPEDLAANIARLRSGEPVVGDEDL